MRIISWPEWDARLYPSLRSELPRLSSAFATIEAHPRVHGILAAPVCTVFANSGSKFPRTDLEIVEALSLVDACLRIVHVLKPDWWALENPVGKLRKFIGPPTMTFDPCDYGDPWTKRTLLWGEFNTELIRTPVEPYMNVNGSSPLHRLYGGKSARTKEARSVTPQGFARAFFVANP